MKTSLVAAIAVLLGWSAPLFAAPVSYFANLDGPSESPPNASPGTGTATVTIDDVANTMRVQVDFFGLVGTTSASHIHIINGPGDANLMDTVGPVATTTPTFTSFPLGVTSGSYDSTFDMTLATSYNPTWVTNSGGTTALAELELFNGIVTGRAYLNIHSSIFPGGEIRGFLTLVPEPGSAGLLLLALVGLVGAKLKSHRR